MCRGWLFFNLSRAYFENNDIKEAKEKIIKALEINPEFKEAKAYLYYLNNQEVEEGSAAETTDEKSAEEKLED